MSFKKKDFAKFCTLFVAIMTVGLWIIKSMWYSYQSGRFSVYEIDSCYINFNDEGLLLQIIQMVAIFVIWFGVNYLYYIIAVSKDITKFQFRKVLKLIAFYLVEMFLLFMIVIIISHVSIIELIKDINGSYIVALLIMLFITCLLINIFGIEFSIEKCLTNHKKKKIESKKNGKINNNEENNDKSLWGFINKRMVSAVIITVALEILIMYIFGVLYENDRRSYKVVLFEKETGEDSKYIFKDQNGQMNYEIYPIIFEDNDSYILTRLYVEDGKIEIDYKYQKVIEKTDVETFNFDNIYNINIGK